MPISALIAFPIGTTSKLLARDLLDNGKIFIRVDKTNLCSYTDFSVDFYRLEACCNEHFQNLALDVKAYTEVSGTSEPQLITSKVVCHNSLGLIKVLF